MLSDPEASPPIGAPADSLGAQVSAGSTTSSIIIGIGLFAALIALMVWIAPGGNNGGPYSGARQDFHDGVSAFNSGRFSIAESKFHKALRSDPNFAGALHYLAKVYRHEGRLDEAETALIRVLVAHPNDPEIRRELGSLLIVMNQPDAAADQYREALKLDAHDRLSWQGLNQALLAAGRDSEVKALIPVAAEQQQPTCNTSRFAALTDEGIGALRISRAVSDIRNVCRVVRDTVVEDTEGNPQRELIVSLGQDTVVAEIVNDRVWRLSIRSGGIRTSDSLGVGTRVSTIRRFPKVRVAMGEGGVYAMIPAHCGLSFQLAANPEARAGTKRDDLRSYSDTASVVRVLVFGCGKR
jgi:hypothetical protein